MRARPPGSPSSSRRIPSGACVWGSTATASVAGGAGGDDEPRRRVDASSSRRSRPRATSSTTGGSARSVQVASRPSGIASRRRRSMGPATGTGSGVGREVGCDGRDARRDRDPDRPQEPRVEADAAGHRLVRAVRQAQLELEPRARRSRSAARPRTATASRRPPPAIRNAPVAACVCHGAPATWPWIAVPSGKFGGEVDARPADRGGPARRGCTTAPSGSCPRTTGRRDGAPRGRRASGAGRGRRPAAGGAGRRRPAGPRPRSAVGDRGRARRGPRRAPLTRRHRHRPIRAGAGTAAGRPAGSRTAGRRGGARSRARRP